MRTDSGIPVKAAATTAGKRGQPGDKRSGSALFRLPAGGLSSGSDQLSDRGRGDQQELHFGLGRLAERGRQLREPLCGKRLGSGYGLEGQQPRSADRGKVARSRGSFPGQRGFLRKGRESRVVLAPAREIGAQFGRESRIIT